jgi:radical SAM-linked protein
MRYRIEFSKLKEARFVSHLDTMKTVERALRRAKIPIAFSEGFNPHPKMSFGSALAVGVTSDKEYLDLELSRDWIPERLLEALKPSLPSGYRVLQVMRVEPASPALMSIINRADYLVQAYLNHQLDAAVFANLIQDFLALSEIKIEKTTKKGKREVDLRPGIYEFSGHLQGEQLIIRMLLQSGSEGNVRPEDVLTAFNNFGNLGLEVITAQIQRLALYIHDQGKMVSPFGTVK